MAAVGSNCTIVVAREASWGTLGGSPKKYQISAYMESVKGNEPLIENAELSADPNPRDAVPDVQDASGDIEFNANLTSLPWWLVMSLGSLATTGAGDPYTHTLKRSGTTLPSFAMEVGFDSTGGPHYKYFAGCMVRSLSIGMQRSGFIRLRVGILAKSSAAIGTSQTLTSAIDWTAVTPLHHRQVLAADMKLNGSANANFREWSLDLNNNLVEDDFRLAQAGVRSSVPIRRAQVTGRARFVFDGLTEYNLAKNATFCALDTTWTETASTRTFRLLLPRTRLEATDPNMQDDSLAPLDMNFRCSKDGSELTSIKAVIVNGQAGTIYT